MNDKPKTLVLVASFWLTTLNTGIVLGQQSSETDQPPAAAIELGEENGGKCPVYPWYCDVPQDDIKKANELYSQGVDLYYKSVFAAAIDHYDLALKYWDHPGIHFSRTLALMALNRHLDAFASCLQALRYEGAALKQDDRERARKFLVRLQGQISFVKVACDESGAIVALDGEVIFQGPGEAHKPIMPGIHILKAEKSGFLTSEKSVLVPMGETASVSINLLSERETTISMTRWSRWVPVPFISAGVTLGIMGGLAHWLGSTNGQQFRDLHSVQCPEGCDSQDFSGQLSALETQASQQHAAAYMLYSTGAAAIIVGATLLYLNRRREIINPKQKNTIQVIQLSATKNFPGLSLSGTF